MSYISAIEKRKGRRVNIFLDGSFAFSLDTEVAAKAGLQEGQELSSEEIEKLKISDLSHRNFKKALHYLSYRPRSEAEVRRRLYRYGCDTSITDKVISKLKELHLLDDIAFAQFWRDNRESLSPRSKQLISQELKQKGVSAEIIEGVMTGLDDEACAYRLGQRKARLLSCLEYPQFRHRLTTYLKQRGFSHEIINQTVKRLWQERESL